MKKRMSRILSVLLISALVVSTAEVAHAEDVAEPVSEEVQTVEAVEETEEEKAAVEEVAEPVEEKVEEAAEAVKEEPKAEKKDEAAPVEVSEEVPEMKEEVQEAADIVDLDVAEADALSQEMKMQGTGTIPVTNIVTGNEQLAGATISYDAGETYTYAVRLSKGVLLLQAAGQNSATKVSLHNANMTELGYVSVSGTYERAETIQIPSAGTYYFSVKASSGSQAGSVLAGARFINGENRRISDGQMVWIGQKNPQITFLTYTAPYTGYLAVATSHSGARTALCNSSGKLLSRESYAKQGAVYGVKKGKTYLIRVNSSKNYDGYCAFMAKCTKVSEKSGKKKSKAVTIKKKKTKKGTIEAGSSQADWYKFKLTKKKKVIISLKCAANEKVIVSVYKGKKRISSRAVSGNVKGTIRSVGKWPKGTYYIKLARGTKTSSGYYEVKWK